MSKTYTELTRNSSHHPFVEQAVQYLNDLPLTALDCGAGAGNASAFLLTKGFQVFAFDLSDQSKEICINRFSDNANFKFAQNSYESYTYPQVSLVIATLSLFFTPLNSFKEIWQNILQALPHKGIFVVDLLGEQDAWVKHNPLQFKGYNQLTLTQLIAPHYEILQHEELCGEYPLASGALKFWHIHRLILCKTSFK